VASAALLGIILALSPVLLVLAIALIIANIPQRRLQANAVYKTYDDFTSNERERLYIRFLLTEAMPAKEVEAYALKPHLLRRHKELGQKWVHGFAGMMRKMDRYALYIGDVTVAVSIAGYTYVIYEGL